MRPCPEYMPCMWPTAWICRGCTSRWAISCGRRERLGVCARVVSEAGVLVIADEHNVVRVLSDSSTVCSAVVLTHSVWSVNNVVLCEAWRRVDDDMNVVVVHM